MSSVLPIGIEELVSGRAVEGVRLELKATWDPDTTGYQVLKTLCAFANDLQNLNGGYVVIGVEENSGAAVRPVRGLDAGALDGAQRWIRGNCNRIEPTYMPVFDCPEIDGRHVLVLWAPASDVRPHQAPDGPHGAKKYWIRIGSETVEARDELLTRLMQQTARVPYDDRRALEGTNEDLRITLVREFLRDVGSELVKEADADHVYSSMQLTRRQNGHSVPRNVGLLFFSDDPQRWFRGAEIEVVEFGDDAGGNTIRETSFKGPLHHQLRRCLTWLESMTARHLEKQPSAVETRGWVSYPLPALREALVNAVYHRSYEDAVEPTKIYLYPNRVEVISYPGPVDGIRLEHLSGEKPLPPVPARNRRIGELLKELRLAEGRGTGVPKIHRSMRDNGSPAPAFDFDEGRTYFRVTLPAHPEYLALSILREYAYRKATGDQPGALRVLEHAWNTGPHSPSVAFGLVQAYAERGDVAMARQFVEELPLATVPGFARAAVALAVVLMTQGDETGAREVLNRLPPVLSAQDAFDAAIAERRIGREEQAHQYFSAAGDMVLQDVRALHEFAQTKLELAGKLDDSRRAVDRQTRERLLQEAANYLERVLQMNAPPARHASAWYDLGRVRRWLKRPATEVREAFGRAVALAPDEDRFRKELLRAASEP